MLETPIIGFIIAALVVLLIPGPGVLYILAQSVSHGYRAGLASVVGLAVGALVHVAAATAGLSAILLASATAFGLIKALGAGYLIYLGISTLLAKRPVVDAHSPLALPHHRLFVDGVLISVFNPKIALFFLAFLPQFVDPNGAAVAHQILFLGLIYVSLALLTDGAYALLAGVLRSRITPRTLQGPVLRYASGMIYLGLGVTAALTGRRN